jgi:hypothetical protein
MPVGRASARGNPAASRSDSSAPLNTLLRIVTNFHNFARRACVDHPAQVQNEPAPVT